MEQKDIKIGYKDVFTQKEYLKHIIANSISRFGDSIDAVAFTWLVYAITGSAAWSAIVFAVNQLPSVLIQPFVGPVIEGMNKKKVMIITDFIRGGIIIGLVILYLTEYLNPWVLLLFTFCNSTYCYAYWNVNWFCHFPVCYGKIAGKNGSSDYGY